MRQAYLEIALIYMYSSGLTTLKEGSSIEILSGTLSGSEDDLSSIKTGKDSVGSRKRFKVNRVDNVRHDHVLITVNILGFERK